LADQPRVRSPLHEFKRGKSENRKKLNKKKRRRHFADGITGALFLLRSAAKERGG